MPAPIILFAANAATKGKATDPVFLVKVVSVIASIALVGGVLVVGSVVNIASNGTSGGAVAEVADECETQLGMNSEYESLGGTNLSTEFFRDASRDQIAKTVVQTALNNGWGYNGALMALYVGIAETSLTNTTDMGDEKDTTSRGIYRQKEGYAWKNAWSKQWKEAPFNLSWEEYDAQREGDTPNEGSRKRARFFNKSNAWGAGGWAENDIRMNPAKATEKFLENLKNALENDFDITKKEFTERKLSNDQMYEYAKATQRFSKDGKYRRVHSEARLMLSRLTIDEDSLSSGSDSINIYNNAVFTNRSGGVVSPVRGGRISAVYGQAGNRWRSGYHTGTDYAASTGTSIYAVTGGEVKFAASTRGAYPEGYGAYGKKVEIVGEGPSGEKVETLYAHLDKIFVKRGQRVTVGQQIGTVGSTGNSTGPHLHLEMRINNRSVDPEQNLAAWGASDIAGTGKSASEVYLFGDSLTVGTKGYFGKYSQGIEFDSDGEVSLFTKDAIYILDDKLKAAEEEARQRREKGLEPRPYTITLRNPKAIKADTWIISLGTNDASVNMGKEQFKEYAERILKLAEGKNVIWSNVYIDRGKKEGVKNINEVLDELAVQYRNVRVLDYYNAVQDNLPYLAKDGVHLTPEGYDWRAKFYSRAIGNLETSYGTLNVEGVDCNEIVLGTQSGDTANLFLTPEEFGGSTPPNTQAAIAVQYALREASAKKPYRVPANPPISYDCSTLTAHAWREAGVKLAPFSGTSGGYYVSQNQFKETIEIPLSEMQPGDLLFYFKHGAHHVSMYIGNGKMVHAASPGRGVVIDDINGSWYAKRFSGVRRVKLKGTQVDTYWASSKPKGKKDSKPTNPEPNANIPSRPNTFPNPVPSTPPNRETVPLTVDLFDLDL